MLGTLDEADHLEIWFSPTCFTYQIRSFYVKLYERNYGDLPGTDTDRSATYDFLLIFHSNYSPISYYLRDKWRYLQNFPTPLYLPPPLRGSLGILWWDLKKKPE